MYIFLDSLELHLEISQLFFLSTTFTFVLVNFLFLVYY